MNSPIFIPEPCHENWNRMSPTEKGRFCKVCTKEVVDFTKKSQNEILLHFENAKGTTCGQFSFSQLNRQAQDKAVESAASPLRKWILSTLAMMGMLGWFKDGKAQLRGKVAVKGEVDYTERHNIKTDTTLIFGSVNENYGGRPISGAGVRIYSGEKLIAQTRTIANGSYRVSIAPGEISMSTISVEVEHLDFVMKEINDFQLRKKENRLNIVMEEEIMMLGEVAFVPEEIIPDTVESIIPPTDTSGNEIITVNNHEPVENDAVIEITCGLTAISNDTTAAHQTQEENIPEVITAQLNMTSNEFKPVLYPNPVNETATIETGMVSAFRIRVLDATGKLVGTQSFSGQRTAVETSAFPAGIYFIEITDINNGNKTVLRAVKP